MEIQKHQPKALSQLCVFSEDTYVQQIALQVYCIVFWFEL